MKLLLALLVVTVLTGCGPSAAERIAQAKIDSAKIYCIAETERVDRIMVDEQLPYIAETHNDRLNQCILEQEAK